MFSVLALSGLGGHAARFSKNASHFFNVFLVPFLMPLGSIFLTNLPPKITKIDKKPRQDALHLGCHFLLDFIPPRGLQDAVNFHYFLDIFSDWFLFDLGSIFPPTCLPKSTKIDKKSMPRCNSFWMTFFDRL